MILDYFSDCSEIFHPTNIGQYTALQILQRFKGHSHIRRYLIAAENHSAAQLVEAYRQTQQRSGSVEEFFLQLKK